MKVLALHLSLEGTIPTLHGGNISSLHEGTSSRLSLESTNPTLHYGTSSTLTSGRISNEQPALKID